MSPEGQTIPLGPWNPGISSQLPRSLLTLSTIFRPENVFTSVEEAYELSDFTGIAPHKLVTFRPERLVVHELLIRVTADLSVPDGSRYADLGINFREITETILSRYIAPHMAEIVAAYGDLEHRAGELIANELSGLMVPPPPPATEARGLVGRFALALGRHPRAPAPRSTKERPEERALRFLESWRRRAQAAESRLEHSVYQALARTVTAITRRRGRLVGDPKLLASLATQMVCNGHGGEAVGRMIEPYFHEAVGREGYRLLPAQTHPIVMNVKGASAAGKSTTRPLQRKLAEQLGVNWADFALISPDIWRKYLLDYDTLGNAQRYAGTFTGHEIEIIDQKLDRYMADKAERGAMSHLLIDRFRFDSFAPESEREQGSTLLTRFGDLIYMFFMITPPDATVERAWKRGLKFGRYKAVDDLLDHNVEAYTGMPRLFFTWALRSDKRVHYEFLDNSVPEGSRPRTVAFGWNGEMNILSVKDLLDVDRYRKINIDAKRPEEVYPDAERMAPENNTAFLRDCARQIPVINFADHESGRIYARLENGIFACLDQEALAAAMTDDDTRAGVRAVAAGPLENIGTARIEPVQLDRGKAQTLGQWGTEAS